MAWLDSLKDPNTRDMLRLLGGAAAALVVGGWAVYTWLHPNPEAPQPVAPVAAPVHQPAPPQPAALTQAPVAGDGGVALAIQGNGNQINTGK
ncbi:MAG: hypothetical protein WC091_16090 [Sulfuricellaceae bacterium]